MGGAPRPWTEETMWQPRLAGCSEGLGSPIHPSHPHASGSAWTGQLVPAQAGSHCQQVVLLGQGPRQATWSCQASIWTHNSLRLARPGPSWLSPSPPWAWSASSRHFFVSCWSLGPLPSPSHPNSAMSHPHSSVPSWGWDGQALGCSPLGLGRSQAPGEGSQVSSGSRNRNLPVSSMTSASLIFLICRAGNP